MPNVALPYFVTPYHTETLARLVALASRPSLKESHCKASKPPETR